jgi:serine/threonine-protein kinase
VRRLQIIASIADAWGMPPESARPAGDVLFRWGRLEIRERIGEGVFGEVYRGWEPALQREIAVKFLRPGATLAAAHVLQEGRNLARIRHPGVVTVHGAEQLDGRVGIWMEHVRGHTLEDLLLEQGPFGSDEALRIGIDLCRALRAVHGAGLVHRDIKTRNVVREDAGRIVLMDFGTGVDSGAADSMEPGLAGTPIYLAPEAASPRSDLYSLGVLLHRLVTGGYPIDGSSLEGLKDAHARGDRRALEDARRDLPAHFARVVERSLAADPARRFATAEQMEAELGAALEAPSRAARRRRRAVAAAAMVAVAAVGCWIAADRLRSRPAWGDGRPTLAVADVVNETHDEELDAWRACWPRRWSSHDRCRC